MKKAIEKPFKVNHKIYVIMTVVSCMGIICGCYWINLNQCSNNIIDIKKLDVIIKPENEDLQTGQVIQ